MRCRSDFHSRNSVGGFREQLVFADKLLRLYVTMYVTRTSPHELRRLNSVARFRSRRWCVGGTLRSLVAWYHSIVQQKFCASLVAIGASQDGVRADCCRQGLKSAGGRMHFFCSAELSGFRGRSTSGAYRCFRFCGERPFDDRAASASLPLSTFKLNSYDTVADRHLRQFRAAS